MSKIQTVIGLIKTPRKLIIPLADNGFLNWIPDKAYLKLAYYCQMDKALDLRNPLTFNEKLQWLKLYDRNPLYPELVDKYLVKKYVEKKIGPQYIIPTYGIWNTPDEIPFAKLPSQFVLKCTHDSGSVIICKDKSTFDIEQAKVKLHNYLNRSIFWFGREWPYKNAKPRIIAEKYMVDTETEELRDYKFFCFNGIVKCYKVDFDRFKSHHANYYDERKLLKIGEEVCPPDFSRKIKLPDSLSEMKRLAETLSQGIPFLRVDFYYVNGEVFFGELTFFPASGFGKFIFKGNDELLGSWLKLPD